MQLLQIMMQEMLADTAILSATITEMGECEEEKASFSHVESRNLKTFVIGVSVLAVGGSAVAWVAYGLASRLLW